MCGASAAAVASCYAMAVFSLRGVSGPLIVHFNDINGIDLTGGLREIAYMAVFGILAAAADYFLAVALVKRSLFWGYFTASMAVAVALLISVALGVIISTNA